MGNCRLFLNFKGWIYLRKLIKYVYTIKSIQNMVQFTLVFDYVISYIRYQT